MLNPSRLSWAYAFSAMFGIGTAVTTVIPIVALALSVPSFSLARQEHLVFLVVHWEE